MRTTVEIHDEHRGRLLDMAAQRGEKGFSRIVNEALEQFFAAAAERRQELDAALAALGSFDDDEAAALEASVGRLRESWR